MKSTTGVEIVDMSGTAWKEAAITREDVASIVVRVMGQTDASVKANIVTAFARHASEAFTDVGDTLLNNGQADDIAMLLVNNIMVGSSGTFGGGTSMSRTEACVVFSKLLNKNILTSVSNCSSSTTQDYQNYTTLSPVKAANIVETSSGYTRVEYNSIDKIAYVEQYNDNFQLTNRSTIPVELTYFVDFYEGENYYYFMFSDNNYTQDDSKEVVRSVKYDKYWNRLGSTSIANCNSYSYINYADMAEANGNLLIHSRHKMYASSDGSNHQANLRFTIDIASMTLLNHTGYVSSNRTGLCIPLVQSTGRCFLCWLCRHRRSWRRSHSCPRPVFLGVQQHCHPQSHYGRSATN